MGEWPQYGDFSRGTMAIGRKKVHVSTTRNVTSADHYIMFIYNLTLFVQKVSTSPGKLIKTKTCILIEFKSHC